jgi:hypothetical protein
MKRFFYPQCPQKTPELFGQIFFASLEKLSFELAFFSSRAQAINWLREELADS